MAELGEAPVSNWHGDTLSREKFGQRLHQYLGEHFRRRETADSGFSIALDGQWGTGKTFLLTALAKEFSQASPKHLSVYVNVWASDYSSDPLLPIHSAFTEQVKKQISQKAGARLADAWSAVVRGMKRIIVSKPAVAAATAGAIFDAGASATALGAAAARATTAGMEKAQDLVEAYSEATSAREEFAQSRRNLVHAIEGDGASLALPIVIVVDELDRCRPTYAISVLETLKHLFSVRGVYFVFGVHRSELHHSVSHVYGQGFQSERYLARFFDQTITLPPPDLETFCENRLSHYGCQLQENECISLCWDEAETQLSNTRVFAAWMASGELSLRDIDQTIEAFASLLFHYTYRPVPIHWLLFLLVLRARKPTELKNWLGGSHGGANHVAAEALTSLLPSAVVGAVTVYAPIGESSRSRSGPSFQEEPLSTYVKPYISYLKNPKETMSELGQGSGDNLGFHLLARGAGNFHREAIMGALQAVATLPALGRR
jgi:hypothetical protein